MTRPLQAERGQLLVDLGSVPVPVDRVGAHVLVDRHEVRLVGGLAAGARDAALRVNDSIRHEARADQRREGQDRSRRVAAGIRDEGGRCDLAAVQLGEAEDGLGAQRRRTVLAVPLLVRGEILQPEVRGQVHDAHALLAQGSDRRGSRTMGIGDEREVCDGTQPLGIELLELQRDAIARIQVVEAAAGVGARRDGLQRDARVPPEQGARPARRRTRTPPPRRHASSHSRSEPPVSCAICCLIRSRAVATSSSVSVRSSDRNSSRRANDLRPSPTCSPR